MRLDAGACMKQDVLEDLVRISRSLSAMGFVSMGEGNTSAMIDEGRSFWIKRSGCPMARVGAADFVKVDVEKAMSSPEDPSAAIVQKARPDYRASIETPLHASIYARRRDIRFVVHAHPPNILAGCCSRDLREFFAPQFPDFVVYLGDPSRDWIFLDYSPPGAPVAEALRARLRRHQGEIRVVVLKNHGALTTGKTADEALGRMEILEKASYVRLMSKILGTSELLSASAVEQLEKMEAERYRQRALREEV